MQSITQARRTVVERNSNDLELLLSRWSIETHSFFTSSGELGLTLEDEMMLTSLHAFAATQVAHFKLIDR